MYKLHTFEPNQPKHIGINQLNAMSEQTNERSNQATDRPSDQPSKLTSIRNVGNRTKRWHAFIHCSLKSLIKLIIKSKEKKKKRRKNWCIHFSFVCLILGMPSSPVTMFNVQCVQCVHWTHLYNVRITSLLPLLLGSMWVSACCRSSHQLYEIGCAYVRTHSCSFFFLLANSNCVWYRIRMFADGWVWVRADCVIQGISEQLFFARVCVCGSDMLCVWLACLCGSHRYRMCGKSSNGHIFSDGVVCLPLSFRLG